MRLLKNEEIKFSADKFLVNKWLFEELMNISGLFRARFVRHYEGYILREFQNKKRPRKHFRAIFNESSIFFHMMMQSRILIGYCPSFIAHRVQCAIGITAVTHILIILPCSKNH